MREENTLQRDRTHAQHRTHISANSIKIVELTGSSNQKDDRCAKTERHAEFRESNERLEQNITHLKTITQQAQVILTTIIDKTFEFPLLTWKCW